MQAHFHQHQEHISVTFLKKIKKAISIRLYSFQIFYEQNHSYELLLHELCLKRLRIQNTAAVYSQHSLTNSNPHSLQDWSDSDYWIRISKLGSKVLNGERGGGSRSSSSWYCHVIPFCSSCMHQRQFCSAVECLSNPLHNLAVLKWTFQVFSPLCNGWLITGQKVLGTNSNAACGTILTRLYYRWNHKVGTLMCWTYSYFKPLSLCADLDVGQVVKFWWNFTGVRHMPYV